MELSKKQKEAIREYIVTPSAPYLNDHILTKQQRNKKEYLNLVSLEIRKVLDECKKEREKGVFKKYETTP